VETYCITHRSHCPVIFNFNLKQRITVAFVQNIVHNQSFKANVEINQNNNVRYEYVGSLRCGRDIPHISPDVVSVPFFFY
jgi:hypothetical protein